MKNSLKPIDQILDSTKEIKDKYIETVSDLLEFTNNTYCKQKESVIRKYDLERTDTFNYFETISEKYLLEKFHSDILFSILNPATPEIGKIANLQIIQHFVDMVSPLKGFIVDKSIKVTKEEYNIVQVGREEKQGYIDLLITNEHNQAIIIENKINNAPDMDNQLVRYMKYVNEDIFEKKAQMTVVYLTLIPGKIPPIDTYDSSFSEYTKLLEDAKYGHDGKILKYRSAVDSDRNKKSLIIFLENCLQELEKENDKQSLLKKIYIEQYKNLLGHLGGQTAMLEYQKDLLKKVYSSNENYKAANDLSTIVQNEDIVREYFLDCLKDKMEKLNFTREKHYINMYCFWIKTKTIYFYISNQNFKLQIGFGNNNEFNSTEQNKYQKILIDVYNLKQGNILKENNWIWFEIEPLDGKDNIQEFLDFYTSKIPSVLEKF